MNQLSLWKGCRLWRWLPFSLLTTAWLCSMSVQAADPSSSLTLEEASRRALQTNPELQVFAWRADAIAGQRQKAALTPPMELGLEAENLHGEGEFSSTDSAELTVSLSSVIEMGGKRRARVAVADSRLALSKTRRRVKALDLLGRVTRDFVVALSLQTKLAVAKDATELAETALQLVTYRVNRGAAPLAEQLRAESALTRARLRQRALESKLSSQKVALATLWRAEQADFTRIDGALFRFAEADQFDALFQRAIGAPGILVYADEARLRDAQVALAQSRAESDLRWSLGVRHFNGSDETALTAGVSMPLFSGRRSRGDVREALAELEIVQRRREAALLSLRSRLFAAWQTYRDRVAAARQLRAEVLPSLNRALEQTRAAYEKGRYSYVDWISAQRELLDARLAAIDAATDALLNQALIEQLTAEPLAAAATPAGK